MKLSPREARNDQFAKLNSDNKSTESYWILINENHVTMTEQTPGEIPKRSISFDKKQFNKLIDWYNRGQKLNLNKVSYDKN